MAVGKSVWKYPLEVNDTVHLKMPEGATVLTVQVQDKVPCLWALVDPNAPEVSREFRIFGTGHPVWLWESLTYLGTFQQHGGALVFHLFEVTQPA